MRNTTKSVQFPTATFIMSVDEKDDEERAAMDVTEADTMILTAIFIIFMDEKDEEEFAAMDVPEADTVVLTVIFIISMDEKDEEERAAMGVRREGTNTEGATTAVVCVAKRNEGGAAGVAAAGA